MLVGQSDWYLGCAADDLDRNAWVFVGSFQRNLLTPQVCSQACAQQGALYGGLRSGSLCFCRSADLPPLLDDQICSVPCVGDATQRCGGTRAFSIFSTQFAFTDLQPSATMLDAVAPVLSLFQLEVTASPSSVDPDRFEWIVEGSETPITTTSPTLTYAFETPGLKTINVTIQNVVSSLSAQFFILVEQSVAIDLFTPEFASAGSLTTLELQQTGGNEANATVVIDNTIEVAANVALPEPLQLNTSETILRRIASQLSSAPQDLVQPTFVVDVGDSYQAIAVPSSVVTDNGVISSFWISVNAPVEVTFLLLRPHCPDNQAYCASIDACIVVEDEYALDPCSILDVCACDSASSISPDDMFCLSETNCGIQLTYPFQSSTAVSTRRFGLPFGFRIRLAVACRFVSFIPKNRRSFPCLFDCSLDLMTASFPFG